MLLFILLGLINCTFEPVLIERFGRSKNKLQQAPPPEFECVDEVDEDDAPPKEYSLKIGALYHLADGNWYLRSEDPTTKQTSLINLNDVTRVKYAEKELEAEKPEEQPEQVLKEFEWTPLLAFERFPRNRGGHSMHAIGDYVVLFGGCFLDIQCFDDLFLFNARTRIWTVPRMFGIPPVGRNGFGAMVNGAKLYIFGGHTLQGLVNDLFVFDLESRSWNQLFWQGQAPTPRSGHKMVLTQLGGLIFGGFVGEMYSNDVYILDIVNERWGKPTAGGDVPIGRESFAMTYHHGVAYVFGGYATGVVLNDVYTIGEDLIWEKKEPAGKIPDPRQGAAMAEYDNRIFVAGGCNPKLFECYNDLYALDISTFHFSTVNAFKKKNLKEVEYAAMVFAGPVLIHFGGCKLMKTCSDSLTGILLGDSESCPPCRNGGVCRVGHCSCQQGWQGIDCTQRVLCKQNCLNQGTCLSNGYCRCYSGYTGSVCQIMIPCPGNCTDVEHGTCQLDGKCKCNEGFSGDTCSGNPEIDNKLPKSEGCLDDCHHHGKCNYQTGLCACDYGYSGPDCSLVQGTESEYKSIWELLKDDDQEPELGTTNVNMKDFLSTAYKFERREEGPVPIFDDDIERVYYVDVDENGNIIQDELDQQQQYDQQYDQQSDQQQDQYQEQYQEQQFPQYQPQQQNIKDETILQHQQKKPHQHKQHKKNKNQQNNNNLQSISQSLLPNSQQLMMVPPKQQPQDEDPFELLLLDECPKRCSEHGVCIKHECYCWFGYSGDHCQASKIGDFYLGWRKRKVIIACIISFFVGMIIGYLLVLLMRKRGNDDEFRNMSEVPSQKIEDNEGEVQEQIV